MCDFTRQGPGPGFCGHGWTYLLIGSLGGGAVEQLLAGAAGDDGT